MRKALLILLLFSFSPEKKYTVEQTLPEWQKHLNKLETVKAIIDDSNLPNQQVKFIVKSIDSLQMVIVSQLRSQLDTTKKK